MRALIFLCEPRHCAAVEAELKACAHHLLAPLMTAVIPFDADGGRLPVGQVELLKALSVPRQYETELALVVAPREVSKKLKLESLSKAANFELLEKSAGVLTRGGKGTSVVHSQVNHCGLSVVGGASEMLNHWTHGQVGRERVMDWMEQFQTLGGFGWVGKALLGQMNLMPQFSLSEKLSALPVAPDEALCVNKDPRGNFKSGDVLGNMLGKRFDGRTIYQNPADAIEKDGAKRILLIEDGLWSGTETVGILDSLLGRRPEQRLKTTALTKPELLNETGVRLAYVVGTDYGQELVRRALKERGLEHITVECIETITVTAPALLAQMADPAVDMSKIIEMGPPADMLRPHVFAALQAQGMPASELTRLTKFCKEVGHQLLGNYIRHMGETRGWTAWDAEKHANAATGMHGLGLSHAFGHSIPKASLPLFWGSGEVKLNGKRVMWRPLLPNS